MFPVRVLLLDLQCGLLLLVVLQGAVQEQDRQASGTADV
jgi:hypothetical protein